MRNLFHELTETSVAGSVCRVGKVAQPWIDVPLFDLEPCEAVQSVTVVEDIQFSTIEQVFNHYLDTVWSGRGARPHLTDKRARIIHTAIKMYGLQPVLEAINGITLSSWHMGNNPQGKKYNNLELILRPNNIEKFSELADNDRNKGGFL